MSDAEIIRTTSPATRERMVEAMEAEAQEAETRRKLERLLRLRREGYPPTTAEGIAAPAGDTQDGLMLSSSDLSIAKRQKTMTDDEKYMPLPEVKDYKGGSHKELREWERALKNCFKARPTFFARDEKKILFAQAKLKGTAEAAWTRFAEKGDSHTWEDFMTYLRRLLTTDANAELRDLKDWRSVKQEGRTVVELVEAINDYESRMPLMPEPIRRNVIIAALRPSLQDEVLRSGILPETREAAIALAIHHEAREQELRRFKSSAAHESHSSHRKGYPFYKRKTFEKETVATGANAEPPKTAYAASPPASRLIPSAVERKKNAACHHCGKKGHYRSECRKWLAETRQDRRVKGSGS